MIHLQHKLNVTFSVRTINFIQFHRQLCAMGFRRKRDGIQLAHRQRTKPCIIRLLNIQYSLFKFAHRTIVSETMESMVHQMFQNDQEKKTYHVNPEANNNPGPANKIIYHFALVKTCHSSAAVDPQINSKRYI